MDRECSTCGTINPPAARFCRGCGGRFEAVVATEGRSLPQSVDEQTCSACSTANPARARFCRSCGLALAAPVSPSPEMTPVADPVAADAAPAPPPSTLPPVPVVAPHSPIELEPDRESESATAYSPPAWPPHVAAERPARRGFEPA